MHETDKLLKQIERLREQMSSVALSQGITSLESIALSQELDRLLNMYEKLRYDKKEVCTKNRENINF